MKSRPPGSKSVHDDVRDLHMSTPWSFHRRQRCALLLIDVRSRKEVCLEVGGTPFGTVQHRPIPKHDSSFTINADYKNILQHTRL